MPTALEMNLGGVNPGFGETGGIGSYMLSGGAVPTTTSIQGTSTNTQGPATVTRPDNWQSYSANPPPTVTTPTQPTQTSAPSNNGLDPHINPQTGVWDDNYYQSHLPQQDLSSQISDAYQPAIDALQTAIDAANTGAGTQTDSVNANFNTGIDRANQEKASLTGDATLKQQDFNTQLKSAYENALRLFNALKQQGIARFGGTSSAGEFTSDLARQEMMKQQRDIGQQQTTGDLAFSKEFAQIGQYVGNKITDLTNWKNDAIGQIKQNLTDTLSAIAQRRGDIESNKTKDKIAALQTAQQNVQLLQNADKTFRQNLAIASISQAQQISGTAFTPAQINAQLSSWGISMNGNTAAAPTSSVYASTVGRPRGRTNEYGQLVDNNGNPV